MNLELRTDVLSKSLDIENRLSDIIKQIIHVPKPETKTLGNQSSALSFKTKADLLYDLDRIDKEDYNLLLLFMEIRNQFIHNIEADSFSKTFEIIGNDRRNRLLKVDPEVADLYSKYEKEDTLKGDLERILKLGFGRLHEKLVALIVKQMERIIEDLKKEQEIEVATKMHDVAMDMLKIVQETTEEFGEIMSEQLEKSIGSRTNLAQTMNSYINQKSIEKLKKKYPELPD